MFTFADVDWSEVHTNHCGIYIHIPFCQQLCAFCPFHKVLYRSDLKDAYLEALVKEINRRGAEGKVEWVYIGGGTPNLLTPDEIGRILTALRQYVDLSNIGMEGNPRQFTPEYLEGVREVTGFL